jgi:hypothetical protein
VSIFSRAIHQRTTKRLAQPTRVVTKLDADQVFDALRYVIARTPPKTGLLQMGEKLWLAGEAPGPWSVYYGPPSRRDPSKVTPVWTTRVGLQSSSDGTQALVTIDLTLWKTCDGNVVGRREFESFRASLAARITEIDPGCALLPTSCAGRRTAATSPLCR